MREFVKRIHFIGIGGIGMSGIAEVLLELDFEVSGSDNSQSAILQRLSRSGARIQHEHCAENVVGVDAVVVSSAITQDNVELLAARQHNIPVVPRAEMLGELMRFRKGIAIAGTHGKTTTTSLVSAILTCAELDPTFIIGGVIHSTNTNARLGKGEYMIAEADESDTSFLHLQPLMAVMTNIDADHLQAYAGNFERLQEACSTFLHNLPFYGLAVLCFDDVAVRSIAKQLHKPMVSYGLTEGVDFRATNICQVGSDSFFQVEHCGQPVGKYQLALPGQHNVLNALAAIAIATHLRIPHATVAHALSHFEGIERRFQIFGKVAVQQGSVELVDDYAHHPTELSATLSAARDCWPQRRLVVVFQPHRYTRTRDLFDDFVQVLSSIDNLLVTQVYPASEQPIAGYDSRSLCHAMRKRGSDPIFVENLTALDDILPNILQHDDVLLTMGAGDIGRFAREIAENGLQPDRVLAS